MLEYVHFVPGRLRLKIAALRQRHSAAEAAAKVAALPMVTSAVANPLTGSLTINLAQFDLNVDAVIDVRPCPIGAEPIFLRSRSCSVRLTG